MNHGIAIRKHAKGYCSVWKVNLWKTSFTDDLKYNYLSTAITKQSFTKCSSPELTVLMMHKCCLCVVRCERIHG